MKLVLSTILILLSCLIYGQKSSRTNISIHPYYSFQKHVDAGVDWDGREFKRTRHGWGTEVRLDYDLNKVRISLGLGYSIDYHRRDSLSLACGFAGCIRGYTIGAYGHINVPASIGYLIRLNETLSIVPGGIISISTTARKRTKSYEYPNVFFDNWGGTNQFFKHHQFFVGPQLSAYQSFQQGTLLLSARYLYPLNRLDKDYDSFAQINFGLGWVFNLKSGNNLQANTD